MLGNYFTTKQVKRGEGPVETIVKLRDDAPEWVHDAVREAHDGEWPDDWRYETCAAIFDCVHDEVGDSHAIADSLVDIYTGARFAWLAGNINRQSYVDEAQDEGIAGDRASISERVGMGQYLCIERMAAIILQAIEDNAEDPDDD